MAGEICIAPQNSSQSRPGALMCELPAASPEEAATLLESVATGGALGSGAKATRLGKVMPEVRQAYETEVARLVKEVERRREAGEPAKDIARWVVNERRNIANRMRWRTGAGTRVLFELRDWTKYGVGGRSYSNMEARYARKGLERSELHGRLIKGATSHNTGISNTALKGARYLKNAGRVVVVLSIASSAYVLLTAPQGELEKLLYEETGSFVGGSLGTGAGVGVCLVFGIATGGWGLLACGAIGGVGGGVLGSKAGERIYYSRNPNIERGPLSSGILDARELIPEIPEDMCIAP